MKIAVLIEPVPGNGFRAKGGEPLAMSAEGATRRGDRPAKDLDRESPHCRDGTDRPRIGSGGASTRLFIRLDQRRSAAGRVATGGRGLSPPC